MRKASSSHTSARIKVSAIGLAMVAVLIVIAAAISGAVNRERVAAAPGGAKPDIVANMAGGNEAAASSLSDMGVASGAGNIANAR